MKSGLYITEIVKRLYRSDIMKQFLPDDGERIRHILKNQVYGMAPTKIIYLIATNYILGFDEKLKDEANNFVLEDAAKAAKEGNPHAIEFPRGKVGDNPYDFSFSGLKSCVLNYINTARMTGKEIPTADLAASFQNAVVEVLVSHTMEAAKATGYKKVAIAGGVASNSELRRQMEEACRRRGIAFYRPSPILCTDNAAMIGASAYYEYLHGVRAGLDLNAVPNLRLGER